MAEVGANEMNSPARYQQWVVPRHPMKATLGAKAKADHAQEPTLATASAEQITALNWYPVIRVDFRGDLDRSTDVV